MLRLPTVLVCLWLAAFTGAAKAADGAPPPSDAEAPATAAAADAPQRPRARPAPQERKDRRCTADGAYCITLASYIPDVCRTLEQTAQEAGLDPGFFARLIWRESLFDAAAVSPVGAQGIAQFMPGTARLRQLADPFNPAEALRASAIYLAELSDTYGNIGLAAVAYNAGEARLEDFLYRDRGLPPETRAYVPAITGYSANEWRDSPPEKWSLALSETEAFQPACEAMARARSQSGFETPETFMPWAVIIAASPTRAGAELRHNVAAKRNELVRQNDIIYRRMRLPGGHGRQWTAQISVDDRKQADRLCWQLRGSGTGCIVLHN